MSVVKDGVKTGTISNLGKLHHATVKFHRGYGYLISRDGLLTQIDYRTDKIRKQVKVGKSAIALNFWRDRIIVANYDPPTVVVVDEDLKICHRLTTGSRNVGLKVWKNSIVFSLMDLDEIWVVDGEKDFQVTYRQKGAGAMPFDALLVGSLYIAGFFKDRHLGILDLKTKKYRKVKLHRADGGAIFKIPHFGLWGHWKNQVYVPALRQKKLYRVNLSTWKVEKSLTLPGMPVFSVVSPDGRYLAVNYSGPQEDYLTIVDRKTLKISRHLKGGRRILHFRYSRDGTKIYLSSYYESKLKTYRLTGKSWGRVTRVATPSGVFLVPTTKKNGKE